MKPQQANRMSSLEVAELTGKRHDNVLRDIRKMISALESAKSTSSNLSWLCEPGNYVDPKGESRVMYLMDKETTLTLLSGYDVVARHKIIQRWQQLESEKQLTSQNQPEQLLVYTDRAKQIGNSKEVNSFNFSKGGKEQAIDYNRKNCFLHTGRTPHELVEWAKKRNVPSRFRTSAKEVVRTFKPAVSSSMALVDDLCKTGKIRVEDAVQLATTHALPIFQKMQEVGLLPADKTVSKLLASPSK